MSHRGDQFAKGIGSKIMKKWGWSEEKGLGKNEQGRISPIRAKPRADREALNDKDFDNPAPSRKRKKATTIPNFCEGTSYPENEKEIQNELSQEDDLSPGLPPPPKSWQPTNFAQTTQKRYKKFKSVRVGPTEAIVIGEDDTPRQQKPEGMIVIEDESSEGSDDLMIIDAPPTAQTQNLFQSHPCLSTEQMTEQIKTLIESTIKSCNMSINNPNPESLILNWKFLEEIKATINPDHLLPYKPSQVRQISTKTFTLPLLFHIVTHIIYNPNPHYMTHYTELFDLIQIEHPEQYKEWKLAAMIFSALLPIIYATILKWENPLLQESKFCRQEMDLQREEFIFWSETLNPHVTWETAPLWSFFVENVTRSKIIKFVETGWTIGTNDAFCLDLLRSWSLLNLELFFENFVTPKLVQFIDSATIFSNQEIMWEEDEDGNLQVREGNIVEDPDLVPMNENFLPTIRNWFGTDFFDPENLVQRIFAKLKTEFDSFPWNFLESEKIMEFFIKVSEIPFLSNYLLKNLVIPKMELCLQEIELDTLEICLSWKNIVGTSCLMELLERSFFESWIQLFRSQLGVFPNEEVVNDYMKWKNAFVEHEFFVPQVLKVFDRCLHEMNCYMNALHQRATQEGDDIDELHTVDSVQAEATADVDVEDITLSDKVLKD